MQSGRNAVDALDASYEHATEGGTKWGPPLTEQEAMMLDVHIDTLDRAVKSLGPIEDAPLPFEGLRRAWWILLHPVKGAKLWRKNRAYRRRKAEAARKAAEGGAQNRPSADGT